MDQTSVIILLFIMSETVKLNLIKVEEAIGYSLKPLVEAFYGEAYASGSGLAEAFGNLVFIIY